MPFVAGKLAIQDVTDIDELYKSAGEKEYIKEFDVAIQKYNEILMKCKDSDVRVKALRYMYATTEKSGEKFDNVRERIEEEILTTNPKNKVILLYLLNDILLQENKYGESVNKFLDLGQKYAGSLVEVDALAKVAMIYGLYLNDKSQAEKYADLAKALNPGHPTLLDAYAAAGISYEPWKYENKYAELSEDFALYDASQPTDKDVSAEEVFVSISPNPANPFTTITYSIKAPSTVKLSIYAINGQKIATLVDGPVSAGAHAVKFDGSKYASGVYFYRFESAGLTRTGKMLLLK